MLLHLLCLMMLHAMQLLRQALEAMSGHVEEE